MTNTVSLRSRVKGNFQARFWRAAALARESLTLILAAALVMLLWSQGKLPGFETSLVDADVASSTSDTSKRKFTGSQKQLGQVKRVRPVPRNE